MAGEDRQEMTTTRSPTPLDLAGFFEEAAERPNRKVLAQLPGLKVMHLTLAPGQALPPHRHPGYHVLLQGLRGTVTVRLEEKASLAPQHLLYLSGDHLVSLRNDGDGPSALLITLVKHPEE